MGVPRSVAVFADCGETRHRAVYRQAGMTIARAGAVLVVLPRGGAWPRHLVAAAREQGGRVTMVAAAADRPADAPEGVVVETAADAGAARARAAALADMLIGLPAGIESVAALYAAWTGAGGSASGKPVGLVNRKRAYEVVRGFIADVASVGLGGRTDQLIQFSDSFEDLWMRLGRLVD